MAVKVIERAYPGRSAAELYVEAERILRRLGEKHGLACQFDPVARQIVVPERMGVKGLCSVRDGSIRIELSHGLLGGALVGTIRGYIDDKLGKLFT